MDAEPVDAAPAESAEVAAVQERYARFAREEAPARSALYAAWASGVAEDPGIAGILARIPAVRRQPPLVFAVSRLLGAPLAGFAEWAGWVRAHAEALAEETDRRSLQTNEPLRCAALLPALALIEGPVALLELGASAGLCLYPDRYSYRYDRDGETIALDPAGGASRVVLRSELAGDPRLRMPRVGWRGGIDLAPRDAADPEDRRFLETLVWPGEEGRAARIRAALDIARDDPLTLLRGDASDPAVLARAVSLVPEELTLVVTTPGVLPHVPRAGRERIVETLSRGEIAGRPLRWITIDPRELHGAWRGPVSAEAEGFVLALDAEPLATVDPLGARVVWHRGSGAPRG
ncbi:DUF2332 domain-containing protein [Microbacterium aurantiacum]|uniref:DUF2332 domain-containing protein n=1 Tax=Microbacterium aurantiacum TaxID=162393 RepID=A0A0M8MNV8_9MICO|nr:DUF2332 domain-containing protein [Microbacterium chocolatum]KOS10850.1 hypothetical protein XI38_08630 [Microbacterium chocolatum]